MPVEFSTPVGRIVWGHPSNARQRTDDNNLPVVRANGEKAMQWSFGVAFTKAEFQAAIWPYLAQEAATAFPNGTPPSFSWKMTDGDTIDSKGVPFSNREGYAGCIILAISTELQAPPIFKWNGQKYDQLPGEAIKTGDYVSVGIDCRVNVAPDAKKKSGLYINPKAVELVGYGTQIVSQGQADPQALFGGRQHALPPGASATPIGGAQQVGMPGMGMPQQPGMMPAPAPVAAPVYPQPQMAPQPQMMPAPAPMAAPGYPQPGMMPAPAPQPQMAPGYPPPAHDFVQGAPAGMPVMPGIMPPR